MTGSNKTREFQHAVLKHLDAAYNLARRLAPNAEDAEDLVQESVLRAFRHFDAFRGGEGRAWLLEIVRNTCYTWLKRHHAVKQESYDEETHGANVPGLFREQASATGRTPEALVQRGSDAQLIRQALDALPCEFREVLVLRELEELSYREIATVAGIPIGTVMSRLARARGLMRTALAKDFKPESEA